jgi:hypothetical protein
MQHAERLNRGGINCDGLRRLAPTAIKESHSSDHTFAWILKRSNESLEGFSRVLASELRDIAPRPSTGITTGARRE